MEVCVFLLLGSSTTSANRCTLFACRLTGSSEPAFSSACGGTTTIRINLLLGGAGTDGRFVGFRGGFGYRRGGGGGVLVRGVKVRRW
jgi:hypothetical protein